MKILFMGTPDFAVESLKALCSSNHEIVGVFCQPDKPVGRKQILCPPPVKEFATAAGLRVYQPTSLKSEEVFNTISELNPDLIAVVAYGKFLPESILNMPKYGCINGHASLLPKYRGASPIQWAIVKGEKQTGVTIQCMAMGMDTGDILETETVDICYNETGESLFDKLAPITAELLLKTIAKAENNELAPKKQDERLATYAPIITKEMALINFSDSAENIRNLIRGFNPWPVAYFMCDGKRYKVFSAEVGENTSKPAGTVVSLDATVDIACGDGKVLKITELQSEGSKRMAASLWLNGKKFDVGTLL